MSSTATDQTGPKFSDTQRAEIRSIVAELDRRGYRQMAMVQLLRERHGIEISQRMVSTYLKQVRQRYEKTELMSRHASVVEKLEQLRTIRQLAFEAWDRGVGDLTCSMAAQVVAQVKTLIDGQQPIPDSFEVQLSSDPNVKYLTVMLESYREECDLLGLYAPKEPTTKINVNNTNQVAVGIDWGGAEQSQEQVAMEQAKGLIETMVVDAPANGEMQ